MSVHVPGVGYLSDSRVLTAASPNTVHATVGPVDVAGTYDVFVIVGASDVSAGWEVQRRDATNSITLESWRIRSFISSTTPVMLMVDLAKGERIRVLNLTSLGGADPIGTPANIGTANNTTGTTITVTVGVGGVAAGQTLFVACSTRGGDLATGLPSVSDNVNGAYTQDLLFQDDNGNPKGAIFRFSNNAALVQNDTITLTISDAIADHKAMTAWSVTGLNLTAPLDQTANAFGSSDTPSSGNLTTSTDNQLLIGALGVAANDTTVATQDADFSSNITLSRTTGGAAGVNRLIFVGDRIISSAETNNYAPTLNEPRQWVASILGYQAASTGTGQSSATIQAMRMK